MISFLLVLTAALAPAAILLYYIYRRDSLQPEPPLQILKATVWGVISALIAILVASPISTILNEVGLDRGLFGGLFDAFFTAAIPEECAKLLCLWLFLRRNPYFDEYTDGLVYAVAVGMGFAGFENILYLFNSGQWLAMGISRALTAVPAHFGMAIIMGYYYSLVHIGSYQHPKLGRAIILVAPIMVHGIYDAILMSMPISTLLALVLMVVFVIFFNKMRKICMQRIADMINKDRSLSRSKPIDPDNI